MWENIGIGDRVRHKDGGTEMIVEAITGDELRMCYWIVDGKQLRESYQVDQLEKVEDQPTQPKPPGGV